MSRRRGEFEHRTSIFEGAFRAWSHLGGLDAAELESKSPAELDPLTNPIINDPRLNSKEYEESVNPDGSKRRQYPYEPLPRSGLAHPYVQAILSPWLGPDADNEAIQLGLTTLRTWWQHRRKGESGSAVAALGTEKMKGVVEGYTRHFFTLAHCLVVNDRVQPPRGLHGRMKELEKQRSKKIKKRGREEGKIESLGYGGIGAAIRADLTNTQLSPLERLHLAQQKQMEMSQGGILSSLPTTLNGRSVDNSHNYAPVVSIPGQGGIPGNIELPSVINTNNTVSTMAHVGGGNSLPAEVDLSASLSMMTDQNAEYGDPNMTPVVFVSNTGDIQIAMNVDDITCSHCIKIVETVLRGCNGNKSPINGLLDAVADLNLKSVLIKIDKAGNAKRIAFEAKRNLSMVGYTARPKEMSIVGTGADAKVTLNLGSLSTAFEVVANTEHKDVFDWTIPCTCPDNGELRVDCRRHSQMNTRIFEAFNEREQQVTEYMAGCGMKYGMDCTCGPSCRCKNCLIHNNGTQDKNFNALQQGGSNHVSMRSTQSSVANTTRNDQAVLQESNFEQPMNFTNFAMGPPAPIDRISIDPISIVPNMARRPVPVPHIYSQSYTSNAPQNNDRVMRNPSFTHASNNQRNQRGSMARTSLRGMSINSEGTFGRAMSGLSALSIDWENLDDFDLEVDHSAHINNNSPNQGGGARRTSVRRSIMSTGSSEPHVSFKV